MPFIQVYHASILGRIHADDWRDCSAVGELDDAMLVSNDGHLVELHDRSKGWPRFQLSDAELPPSMRLCATHMIHVYRAGELYEGSVVRLESLNDGDVVHPNAVGNREDQRPGLTSLTVVGTGRILESAIADWKRRMRCEQATNRSRIFRSTRAAKIEMDESEFAFTANLDVMMAAMSIVQYSSSASLVLGDSITTAVGVPFTKCTETVDTKYGPFEQLAIGRP